MTLILALLALGVPGRTDADAGSVEAVVDGRHGGTIAHYSAGGRSYLGLRDAAAALGGQSYWYPLSGRVRLTLRGRPLELYVGSAEARTGDRRLELDAPVLLRGGQAYAPASWFVSRDFADWSGAKGEFQRASGVLGFERVSTVGAARWFGYGGRTRIVMEVAPGVGVQSAARGLRGVEVIFPLGRIESAENIDVADERVAGYALKQDSRSARLTITLARAGIPWRLREFPDPRRIAIDVGAEAPWDQAVPGGPAVGISTVPALPRIMEGQALPTIMEGQVRQAGERLRKPRIVVDAGHGGKDPGARGRRGTLEKDVALKAALELARLLRDEGAFEVILTRGDDTFVPLAERSRIANEAQADLFVSIHCNSSPQPRDSGFEVYFLSEKASDADAERLAELENSVLKLEELAKGDDEAGAILRAMVKTENINEASELAGLVARAVSSRVDIENRGVKQASFFVLRGTQAPAVLAELAYLSNRKEEARLQSRRFRRKMVDGLYAGVLDYSRRQGWLKR